MKVYSGFTLIETIIYIALLGLIMTGAVAASYQILQGSSNLSNKATVQDEGSFVLRKVGWALSGASAIPTPSGSTLTVSRYDGNTIDFRLNGTAIEMRESVTGLYEPITTPNVRVESLQFQIGVTNPKSVTVIATIKTANGTDAALPFTLTRYLRK
ncbi:MAG: hypothetical protein DDT19_01424 [Syntrophomonadaceae bacterium]|nr:hypothetical protein [Bacillota bacterium]